MPTASTKQVAHATTTCARKHKNSESPQQQSFRASTSSPPALSPSRTDCGKEMDQWDRLLPTEALRCVTPGKPCVPCPLPLPPSLPAGHGKLRSLAPKVSNRDFITEALRSYEATNDIRGLVRQLQSRPDVWRVMRDKFISLLEPEATAPDKENVVDALPSTTIATSRLAGKPINVHDDTALRQFFSSSAPASSSGPAGDPAELGTPRHVAPSRRRHAGSRSSCGSSAASSVVLMLASSSSCGSAKASPLAQQLHCNA